MRLLVAAVILFCSTEYAFAQADQGQSYWYYCDSAHGYSPYLKSCPEPWRAVPAQRPISPAPMTGRDRQKAAMQQAIAAQRAKVAKERAQAKVAEKKAKAEQAVEAERERRAELERREAAEGAATETRRKADEQRKQQEQIAATVAERRKAALDAQIAADERDGYRRSTVADVILDYRSMSTGDRVVISGYFTDFGQIAAVTSSPYDFHFVYIDTSGLPRESRKRLLQCPIGECVLTIWGHTGCVMTVLGKETAAACVVVDRARVGRYEQAPISPVE